MTGWNMPPGCNVSDIPGWDAPDPTPLQEAVWKLLENAGLPAKTIEAIDEIIVEWQNLAGDPEPDYSPEPDWYEAQCKAWEDE